MKHDRILKALAELAGVSWEVERDYGALVLEAGKQLDTLLAAIPRWRPIETAPRDGTEILGYEARLRIGGLMSYERESVGVTRGMWATTDGGYQRTPTHWMPLPAAPEESNG